MAEAIMELPLNSKEKAVINSVFEKLVVELGPQAANKADVESAIKKVWDGRPGWAIKTMMRLGLMVKEGENLRLVIKNKGGEKMKNKIIKSRKITKEERDLCKFLIENKSCYKGKKIRGLDIWGIGQRAITLGNIRIEAFTDGTPTGCGPIHQCDNKEFHNFFKKINKNNSFDDGVELAKEIIKKYGYLNWEEEQEKYNKEIESFYKENY